MTQDQPTSLDRWRNLAQRFHVIRFMVSIKRLPEDFEPADFDHMVKHEGLSRGELSVMRFLLHTWNGYDNPFEMRDILGWDECHLGALADWITGKATGEPVHYF
jgi:hypothetical protein